MDKKLLELYSDYLLCSFGATTATGLSALLEGRISHDRVTRFLSQADYNGKTLWRQVKGMIRDIEQDDGVLIFDDTIQEKPYTDENDLICWHYDHSQSRTVKGINLLNCVYHASDVSLPVTYELITKPVLYTDVKTRRVKRKSLVTKNDLMRDMLSVCKRNRIKYRYVLADSWFSAKENLQFIRNSLDKHFVVAIKSNRTVALSYEDKRDGRFARIDAQNLTEDTPVQAWIKGLDFPVLLIRQVFTNKDESTGEMFLACSDLTCDGETIETIYQKRWKVETFHKTLKSNAALSKSPTRRVRTQSNHCFMAIYAAAQLEGLRVKHHLNHFALRSRLYLKAIRYALMNYKFLKLRNISYNNELGRNYWKAVLKHRFPGVDAKLLYDAWTATSEIVPQVNRAVWSGTDGNFAPEGCMQRQGFLTVDDYNFDRNPMRGSGIHSVTEWAKAFLAGKKLKGITPLQVADNLDEYAATALEALPALRAQMGDNMELQETLNDIESMAYLGRYYADKMRGAAKLAVFRENRQRKQFNDEAVAHFKDAVEEWKTYAAILSSQYKTQLMARTHFLDWNSTLKEVKKEVVAVQREGDYPDVRFTNLKAGAHFPAGTELRVEVNATDGDGIKQVKLYLNGLLIEAHATKPQVWSGSSDALLKALKPGIYHLEAVAEDKTGMFSQREIQIAVGDVSENSKADWRDEIHQVILNEGERFMIGDVRVFPRLECYLKMHDNGKLVLRGGAPGRSEDAIWRSRSKDPDGGLHYAAFEKGQLVTYRGTPDHPEVELWKSKKVSDPGTYKLGITVSRKLVVFREVEGEKRKIVWRSNN